MAVSKRTRFEVFKRDKFTCQYCGRNPPTVVLHLDHVLAQANGGTDDQLNLITSCLDCNLGKSDVPLGQVPRPLAEQMEEAAERREQVQAFNQFLLEEREIEDGEIEELGTYWYDLLGGGGKYVFGADRRASVRTFVRKLGYARVLEAIDIAHGKVRATMKDDGMRFKYFCGVCWSKIRQAEQE